jgi:anti-sigma factor RsiW
MNDTVAELCSAYLDDALDARERADFERRLKAEPTLAEELEAMRAVVSGLRTLPQVAPSPVVELALAERVALALEERGLAARLARRFPRIAEQPVIAVMFATVLAFATIIGVWVRTVDPAVSGRIPVVLDPPTPAVPEVAVAVRSTAVGRFHLVDGTWIAADVVGPPDRLVAVDDPLVAELVALEDIAKLLVQGPVRLRFGGEVIELRQPPIADISTFGAAPPASPRSSE